MTVKKRSRRKKSSPDRFAATCGAGLESLVAAEIDSFGGRNIETSPGAVSWSGNLETGYRACLWSRFASRILLTLAEFEAPDPDTLYQHAGKIEWDIHFNADSTFAVYCTLSDAQLTHSHYASLKIKDAIVDQFRARTGKRPNIDVQHPGIRLNLHVKGT
ncbi:MAG: 23S rRNA (guanine(2445)-N(2))/(guanine(2069)-N(7))-methyltransferase, partial [Desulfobulbaceae bacterium]|nr:23S rRNA (guanine(2445)-N(2))/(guanine(2069)-N(7))-methyltransferase [Desulfobulbaceae bacterium]